jgi:hypothetical protein
VATEVVDRDLALYQDHARGMRKIDLAAKYGLDRHTVSRILDRVKAELPPVDRGHAFDQSLEIIDGGLAVFVPQMLDGDKAAGRLVDRLLGRRAAFLGLENPQKLELSQAQNQHHAVDVKAELAALLTRIRGNGHA